MKYLIDGYNLIHKITQLKDKRLRSQREGLIRILERTQAQDKKLKSLTVVFDGQKDVFAPRAQSTVKIIFSRGKSADKKIGEILESSTFARDIAVVSDDRQVKFYAGSSKAKKISVDKFLKVLSLSAEKKSDAFKLDQIEVARINQELARVWLNK